MSEVDELFDKMSEDLKSIGYSFYSKKISDIEPSTLTLFCSRSKQFTTFIYVDSKCTRVDMFLMLAEDKAEKFDKQEIKPYTVKKNDKGFWVIENI
jgi:hypothetical protein